MLRGREIVIIFFGILFCGLWLFFTQRVQQNQLASHERSIDLMMGSAEENLRKYFQMPLEVKGEDVSPPFSFLLSLNHETLEPKIFITNKELKSKLSAFSIKSAYKASGKKNNLFVYKSKRNNEDRTYLVRVIMTGNALRLEGMSLRNIQNALGYVFKDENWLFTDFENHILVGSGELNQKRLRAKELRSDYIAKPMVVENFRMKLYVKKNVSYSVTLANILGLFGIALMTFSLLNFRGESEDESLGASRGAYKNESETNPMSFEDGFEDGFEEEEMQVVRLENNTILNQQSIKTNNKKPHTSASNSTPASNPASASSASASASSSGSGSSSSSEGRVNHLSRELDYGDFLMENPILGESPGELLGKSSGEKVFIEKRPEFLEEFLEKKESLLNSKKTGKTISGKTISSIEKKLIEKNEITPSVESIEDSIGENKTSSKHSSSTHSSNTHSNKYSSKQESVAISDEDEWLKLAEELTENLEEFAQNYKEFSSSSSSSSSSSPSSSPSSSSSNDDDKTNTNSSTNLSTNLPTNSPTNLKG